MSLIVHNETFFCTFDLEFFQFKKTQLNGFSTSD